MTEFGKFLGKGHIGGRRAFCKECGKHRRANGRRAQAAAKRAVVPHKTCTRCERDKPLPEFGPYSGTLDGHDFLCHDCRALATAERERRATAGARAAETRAALRAAR